MYKHVSCTGVILSDNTCSISFTEKKKVCEELWCYEWFYEKCRGFSGGIDLLPFCSSVLCECWMLPESALLVLDLCL